MVKSKPKSYLIYDGGIVEVEHHEYRSVERLNQKPVPKIRVAEPRNRKTWVKATGSLSSRIKQAKNYLKAIDHEKASRLWKEEQVLGHAVSNLRNYHGLDKPDTIALIQIFFNCKSLERWSDEAIALTWDLVQGYTPSLGLYDPTAVSKRHTEELEDLLVDLLAFTRSGGRVAVQDLFDLFRDWNPDFEVNEIAFGRAFTKLTGIKSKPSKGIRYYSGLRIPSMLELKDSRHSYGAWVDTWDGIDPSNLAKPAA